MDDVDRYLAALNDAMTNTPLDQRMAYLGGYAQQAPPEYFERKQREFDEAMDFQRRVRERLAEYALSQKGSK